MKNNSIDVISSTELALWHKYKDQPKIKLTLWAKIIKWII